MENMDKDKVEFYEKLNKLLDCEGILILKGEESWINFMSTFFPEELKREYGFSANLSLRKISVKFAKNPTLKTQTIIDLGNE